MWPRPWASCWCTSGRRPLPGAETLRMSTRGPGPKNKAASRACGCCAGQSVVRGGHFVCPCYINYGVILYPFPTVCSPSPPTAANQEGVCVVWIWGKDAQSWLLSPIHLEGSRMPETPAVWASYCWVITVLLLAMDGLDSHSPSGPSGCQTKHGGCSDFSVRSFCSVADNPEVEIALNVSKAG